jgi:hypothetical protein
MVLLQPGISAEPKHCQVLNCNARWTIVIRDELSPTVRAVVLGEDFDCVIIALCQRHYKYLRTKDGVTLGYRKVRGVLRAYVKDESF